MEDDPSYDLSISRLGDFPTITDEVLTKVIRATLRRHESTAARISVALVDDARMARLNKKHLGHDGPTDVLTFDLREDPNRDGRGEQPLDAELVISTETADRESRRRSHSLEAEVALYAVHGTLHLLGYDDTQENDAVRMHAEEDRILIDLGVGAVYGSEIR